MSGHLLYVQDAHKLIIAPSAFTNKQSTGSKICFKRSRPNGNSQQYLQALLRRPTPSYLPKTQALASQKYPAMPSRGYRAVFAVSELSADGYMS